MANEMLEIMPADSDEPVTALALNLEEDNIGAVILGDWTALHEGDQVRRTGPACSIFRTGPGYIGPCGGSAGKRDRWQGADRNRSRKTGRST